jgi:hypothetical protein
VEELARRIQAASPELRPLFLGMFGAGNVAGITYQRVLESARMGLNLSRRSDVYLYSSNRMAHLVGNGILTFIDRATGFGELFGEDELAFYGTEAELFDKLRLYQNDDAERRRVAERGWRKYHRIFGCEVVAKYLIDAVEGKVDPARFDWAA